MSLAKEAVRSAFRPAGQPHADISQRPRDMRLRMGDVVFVRGDSELMKDKAWE